MTKTAKKKAERAALKLAQAARAAERLATAGRDYAAFRRAWQREWRANVADMREQRLARIRRRDALLAWLLQYETWREENGRPIAYCRRAPAPEIEEARAA
jgi:hypothetical protein